jgi:Secretion system C-terminal sorting domain
MKKWYITFFVFSYFLTSATSQGLVIEKDIISSGATSSKNDNFILNATVGQPIIGIVQEPNIINHQGFWYVISDFTSGSTNTEDLPIGIIDINILPNPTSYQGTLTFVAKESMPLSVDILSSAGQKTAFHYSGDANEGKNIIPIDVSNLIAGQYFLTLKTKEKTFTKKIVIIK